MTRTVENEQYDSKTVDSKWGCVKTCHSKAWKQFQMDQNG